ncbi:MAG: terpene cyclase/mutase family protein [Planctomycetes bacterium]|nr:terpene cyclase/mutase family protein [Planctomycetota bacterium]
MSEKKPEPANGPAAKGAGAAVIRRLEASEETSQERLMKKHVPAWVISGAVHVGLIAIMILLFGSRGVTAKPPMQSVVVPETADDEQPEMDLTKEDIGLQSNLDQALPEIQRIDKQNVEALVTMDNIGQSNAPDTSTSALAPAGVITNDSSSGVPGDSGNAITGPGGEGGSATGSFPGRSGSTKTQLLREGGGNAESEAAVARGLAWLARQQMQDGGWQYDAGSKDERIAATGMALLPFLAAGETHQKGKKYTKTVNSGLQFLLRNCPLSGATAGRMSGNMYAHAIGTLALCEAYGMTKDKGFLLAGAQAAINHIVKAQAANGSWGYSSGAAGDTSIVGWQIQALKAAKLGKDIIVPAATMKKAVDFLNLAGAGSRKAMYGYNDNTGAAPGTSLTAVGLLSRYYIDGWGPDNAGMAEGVSGLMKRTPVKSPASPDMYFYYYATQVVHFFEGDEWKTWNEGPKGGDGVRRGGMRDWLVSLQNTKDGANFGSYDPGPGSIGGSCGRLGTTAMSILTLEVYYRHLPLYKRANAGDGALKIVDGAK